VRGDYFCRGIALSLSGIILGGTVLVQDSSSQCFVQGSELRIAP
jgi:hypothetical protein